MTGYQRMIVCGNVGKDPDIKVFTNGGKIANFSVATSETWKDKTTGEKKERTEWHKISVKDVSLIDNVIEKYVRKGGTVLIEGILETRDWEKDGVKHYTTEVVVKPFNGRLTLMGSKKGSGSAQSAEAAPETKPAQSNFNDMDDEIPF